MAVRNLSRGVALTNDASPVAKLAAAIRPLAACLTRHASWWPAARPLAGFDVTGLFWGTGLPFDGLHGRGRALGGASTGLLEGRFWRPLFGPPEAG